MEPVSIPAIFLRSIETQLHELNTWIKKVSTYTKKISDVTNTTSDYTVGSEVHWVRVDASSGAVTVTLPPVGTVGRSIGVIKIDSSSNAVTVDGNGSETISSTSSITLSTQYESISLIDNGTSWDVAGLFSYTDFTWTPVLTFVTAGNLSVAYSQQTGTGTKIRRRIDLTFQIDTSTFTHTTASGNVRITGSPYTAESDIVKSPGALEWQGITKANYTNIVTRITQSTAIMNLVASGSGQNISTVTAADMPTGGAVSLRGSSSFIAE